jgi:hypothetical protein
VCSSPGRDLEGLEAVGPGRAGAVPSVDAVLDALTAVGVSEGVDDESGGVSTDSGHSCNRRGDR